MANKRIPVYKAELIDDGTGMTCISLVDRPAVEKDFLALAEQAAPVQFAVADEDRHLVWGVVARADFPIYRRDENFGEYYVTYTAEVIRKMAEKYLAEGRQNEVDLQHDGKMVEGVQLVQFVIKDTARGVVPAGFDDVADGSLFAEFHVTDPDIWQAVKDGTYNGFSLEGLFNFVPTRHELAAAKVAKPKSKYMNKIKQAFKALAAVVCRFGYIVTDKAIISWDGDEDLKAGDEVYIEGEDGSREPIADGEYRTEDDKVIVVADGKVSEIRDEKAEVATDEPETVEETEEISAARQAFNARRAAFELTYDEKYAKIYEALAAAGIVDCYIIEAGDEFAVVEVWSRSEEGNEESHDYRYPLTWDGDTVTLGDRVEVKPIFVPLDYEDPFTAEEAEAMQATIEQLTAKVEQLSKAPAAQRAHEEVKTSEAVAEKMSRLERILNA